MKLARVRLTNILGIGEVEFDAGKFNEIAGDNNLGKTSILNGIKAGMSGGNDVTILRNGADKGEIVLEFDNNTIITKRVTPNGTTVNLDVDGVRQKKPQETINEWYDQFTVNPVAFLNADEKRRVSVLLESLPMQADPDRLRAIIGDETYEVDIEAHALVQIKSAYDSVFADRRETNRVVKEKESTINQLSLTLPPGDVEAQGNEDELDAELRRLDDAQEAEMQRIDTKLGALRAEHDAKVDGLRQKIAELQAEVATEVGAFSETRNRAEGQRSISTGRWRESRQPVVDALNLVRSNRDAVVRAETTRQTMRDLRGQADRLDADSKRMTEALGKLDAYKAELLDNLPIPGLVVEDGVVKRDGIAFDRLNEAQQVEIAFELAKLRGGKIGIACVDGIEKLSERTYQAFKEHAMASDLQLFVTRVTDDEQLQIHTA